MIEADGEGRLPVWLTNWKTSPRSKVATIPRTIGWGRYGRWRIAANGKFEHDMRSPHAGDRSDDLGRDIDARQLPESRPRQAGQGNR